jgi:hypothetical protein
VPCRVSQIRRAGSDRARRAMSREPLSRTGMLCVRASVRPDAPLLDHDASLTFTYFYPLVPLSIVLSARLLSPSSRSSSRRTARLLALPGMAHDRLRVTALGCGPCQAWHAVALSKSRDCDLPAARATDAFLPRRAAIDVGPRLRAPPSHCLR